LLLAFVGYDIAAVPHRAIHPALARREHAVASGRSKSAGDAR
jgi:hypothetical protein